MPVGADDGVCEIAPNAAHDMQLDELVVNRGGVGMSQIRRCCWCGATSYEASAADDPRRAP